MREVFEYYASFGDRLNTRHLKSQKYHKMLNDAHIDLVTQDDKRRGVKRSSADHKLMNKKRMDLIFVQVNSHKPNMPYEVFLHSLIKIAEFKYPNYSPGDGLKAVVSGYMLPLHDKIM